ncbi:hypothetical protein D3C72_2001930 [compost metagenome]
MLPAQPLTLVKQQLQAGEARIRRHRQAPFRPQKLPVAGQHGVLFVRLTQLQPLGQLVAQGSPLGGRRQIRGRLGPEQECPQQGRAQGEGDQQDPSHSPSLCKRLAC